MTHGERRFNPPPGWPPIPKGWKPPAGWTAPRHWPPVPSGWQLWLEENVHAATDLDTDALTPASGGAPQTIVTDDRALDAQPSQGSLEMREEDRAQLLEAENIELRRRLTMLEQGSIAGEASMLQGSTVSLATIELNDQEVLQQVGIYRYHHPLENAAAYLPRLQEIEARSARLVREGRAIEKSNLFTFDNSLAKGRKMSDDLSKLMLRAYNAEAENGIRVLRLGNVQTAKKRLEASRGAIAKLGGMMAMRISDDYHGLRLQEIELTADWLMKKQEEKEERREERARLREEARVREELKEQRARLDKELALLVQTISQLRATGASDVGLESRLADIEQAIADNDFRAANIRAGHVYVISNRGAFGEGVVKIGLTRRLEPADRVLELGGASVPFRFDIHTIYFSEDAVTLETELHRHFAERALNQANSRKEFFFATPGEVRDVLASKVGNLLEFKDAADATEFFQSVSRWPLARRPEAFSTLAERPSGPS